MGVQCSASRPEIHSILSSIHDVETEIAVQTERSFLENYGGGCHVAAGCFAQVLEDGMIMAEAFASVNHSIERITMTGRDAKHLGIRLAEKLAEIV